MYLPSSIPVAEKSNILRLCYRDKTSRKGGGLDCKSQEQLTSPGKMG